MIWNMMVTSYETVGFENLPTRSTGGFQNLVLIHTDRDIEEYFVMW